MPAYDTFRSVTSLLGALLPPERLLRGLCAASPALPTHTKAPCQTKHSKAALAALQLLAGQRVSEKLGQNRTQQSDEINHVLQ